MPHKLIQSISIKTKNDQDQSITQHYFTLHKHTIVNQASEPKQLAIITATSLITTPPTHQIDPNITQLAISFTLHGQNALVRYEAQFSQGSINNELLHYPETRLKPIINKTHPNPIPYPQSLLNLHAHPYNPNPDLHQFHQIINAISEANNPEHIAELTKQPRPPRLIICTGLRPKTSSTPSALKHTQFIYL